MTASTANELWRLGATELAHAIRTGWTSSTEVVEAHLRRIDEVNARINAVVAVLADEALEAARTADRAIVRGDPLPPFHGIPFTVKDNIDVAGTPTTQGLRALQDAYPAEDAPVVARMKHAGAIAIGRTNLPSGAIRWHTDSELWGPTVNPWDPTRTPGASSGGEAAAIATGMSPLGLGNDGLGSLRYPAQCCGIAALKPTLGRVPHASSVGQGELATIGMQLTSVDGPLARRIADLRAAFEIIAGPTPRDPWSVPAPLRGPGQTSPVRVALVPDPAGRGVSRAVEEGVRAAGRALEAAGHDVDEVEPPGIEAAAKALLIMLSTPGTRQVWEQAMAPGMPEETRRFMAAFFGAADEPDAVAAEGAFVTRHRLLHAWSVFQRTRPLIVAPIATEPPFRVGTDLGDGRVAETIETLRMTIAINALGLPAVAVPVGVVDGLPQAVQVIGPRFREDLCLDAAEAIESAAGVLTPIDPR
jgi:amidase